MLLQEEREKIVEYGQEMLKRGLTAGTFCLLYTSRCV